MTPLNEADEIKNNNIGVALVVGAILVTLSFMCSDGIALLIESFIPYPKLSHQRPINMLTKEELHDHNRNFWKILHQRMREHKSTGASSVNWLKYPTRLKHVYLRLEADKKRAALCFDIQIKNEGIRAILWEQMTELKVVLTNTMECEANWLESTYNSEGQEIARIEWELIGVNYFLDRDLPKIHDFLEEKLLKFDIFYQEYNEILILLMQ